MKADESLYNQTLNMSLLKYFPEYINRPELYLSIKIGKNMESFHDLFSFGCKSCKQSGCKGQSQTATPIKHQIHHLEPPNTRESILDFTASFGEINPDMPYLCRRGQSGLQRTVFASFPSVRREPIKKNVKSSIFRKKTSKFLSSLPFKA